MKTPKYVVAALLCLTAFGALAEVSGEPVPAEAAPAPEAVAKPDKMICTNEVVTGSLLPRRVCMTESERAARREEARRALDSARRKTPARGGG